MALIRCPECGREISDQAAACPGCGYPMGEPGKDLRERLLAEAKRKDRIFLGRAGAVLLAAILILLAVVVLIARGIL